MNTHVGGIVCKDFLNNVMPHLDAKCIFFPLSRKVRKCSRERKKKIVQKYKSIKQTFHIENLGKESKFLEYKVTFKHQVYGKWFGS